jgi:hypothetical protein
MKWVKKLLPSFEKLHPGKKMVLLLDNAPYHHKRQIGNLTSKSKKQLVGLCIKHGINKINVEWNNNRVDAYANYNVDEDMVKFKDTTIKLTFSEEVFLQRPTTNQPFAPAVNELRLGIVSWLKDHRPDLLECIVTKTIEDAGHMIIWTPPYTPDLQPIKLFWGIGKNYAAEKNTNISCLKDVVSSLRNGFGNNYVFDDNIEHIDISSGLLRLGNDIIRRKQQVDCGLLFNHMNWLIISLFLYATA